MAIDLSTRGHRERTRGLRLVGPGERIPAAKREARGEPSVATGPRDARRLVLLTVALVSFGLIVVLSASSVVSIVDDGSPWSVFEKQAMWSVIGGVAFAIAMRIELSKLRRAAVPILVISGIALLAVFVPGLSESAVGGSSRWIGVGPLQFQPSELAKLAFCVFAADLITRRAQARDVRKELVYPLVTVLGVMAILILRQPDMGTAVVLCCIASGVLFAGGVSSRILVRVFGVMAIAGVVFALSAPYRRARLFSFVNPFAHASTTGYQIVQSLVALGSGHITGTGLGGSVAKWGFLPNAWTDFVFAVIGNELGLIGGAATLVAFALFAWLGIRIAAKAQDRFSSLLATGITCWIVCQAIINIGGVVGVLPETGIPLPFLSSGGSSLVVTLAAVGLLVNVGRSSTPRLSRTDTAGRRARGTTRPTTGRSR